MSSIARWSYKEGPCTVWPAVEVGDDPWGIGSEAPSPYLIPRTDYEYGGKIERDRNGEEFVPRLTVYFEAEESRTAIPKLNDRVKVGDHTSLGSAPADAEIVRDVRAWPMEKFGEGEIPDWKVVT